MRRLYAGAASIAGPGLPGPGKVTVKLTRQVPLLDPMLFSGGSSAIAMTFDKGQYRVPLGETVEFKNKISSKRASDVMAVHELGHALLQEKLLRIAPRFAALVARNDATKEAANRARIEMGEHLSAFRATKDPAETAVHDAAYKRSVDAMFSFGPVLAKQRRLLSVAQPFQELFADSFAVLHAQDGGAVRDALGEIDDRKEVALRDFEKHISVRQTKALMNDREHDLAAPVRSFVWKSYQRRAHEAVDPRPAMLESLATQTAALIERRLRHGHASLDTMSIAGFARALRKTLQADPQFVGAPAP